MLRLVDVVPEQYRAAIWLGTGQGTRLGEVLGIEDGTRCADFVHRELHVVQQLRHSDATHGGFFLAPPKSGSSGTVDLDPLVAEQLVEHLRRFPQRWSTLLAQWRDAAGWPKEGTFHSLRHFFATTLMSNGVEPQDVQKALRHANLRITLETYVHWLPKKDRPPGRGRQRPAEGRSGAAQGHSHRSRSIMSCAQSVPDDQEDPKRLVKVA